MRLVAIRFLRFRCLYDSGWLPLSGLAVLVGQNDSGKSAVLDGIAIVLSRARGTDEDISFKLDQGQVEQPEHEDSFEIEVRVSAESPEDFATAGIPVEADGSATIGVQYKGTQHEWFAVGQVPEDASLRVDPLNLNINELRDLLRSQGRQPVGAQREPIENEVKALISQSAKVPGRIELHPDPLRTFFEIVDFRKAEDVQAVLNATLRTSFEEMIASSAFDVLRDVEVKVKAGLQKKANELRAFIRRYRADVGEVLITPRVDFASGYQGADIAIADLQGNDIPLRLRGQGMRAHLRLAAFEWTGRILGDIEGAARIFLLDEPDTHLDYHSQRRLLGAVEEYAKRGQVVVATHSINLINRVNLDQIIVLDYDRASGQSRVKTMHLEPGLETTDINAMGLELGVENAVLLYERAFVLFEGQTEENSLPAMYERWTGSKWYLDGVTFQNAWNNEGAVLLARLLHLRGRPVVALIDEDTTQHKEYPRQFTRQKLEGQALLPPERIKTIGDTFFEMAFSDDVWARVISVATAGKRRPRRAKLAHLRDDPTKYVKFVQKVTEMSKPELGTVLGRVTKRGEIPPVLTEVFDIARELAGP